MIDKYQSFESPRLLFRGMRREDAATIVRWRNDGKVNRYFYQPKTLTVEDHLRWYESYLRSDDRYDFLILCKKDDGLMGTVTLSDLSNLERVEIGYAVAEEKYQCQGYAKEAITALMQFAAKEFGATGVRAEIHRENIPSLRTVQALGFVCSAQNPPFLIYQRKCEW